MKMKQDYNDGFCASFSFLFFRLVEMEAHIHNMQFA